MTTPTSTTLTVSASSATVGDTVRLTAQATPAIPGTFTIEGDGRTFTTSLTPNGSAFVDVTLATAGTPSFTATFTPDPYEPSTSAPVAVTVAAPPTTPNLPAKLKLPDGTLITLGINVPRTVELPLIAYTRTATQTVTPTNRWGRELTVVGGKVTAATGYPRSTTTDTSTVSIPADGYVLSGWGDVLSGKLAALPVGASVVLLDSAGAVTAWGGGTAPVTPPVDPPVDPPVTPPTGAALPDKIVGGYMNMYQGPATAELPDYNVLFAAFALGGGGQNMHFITPAKESVASFKAGVKADQARGAKWLLSIGGGVPANEQTFIQNAAQADTVFNKLVPIIDEYGFNGLDYDLENGPGGFSKDGLLALSRKLRAKYGTSFAITMTPRPYEDFYFTIAAAHHAEGLLDALQMQFYDEMKTRDDAFLASWIPQRLDAAKNAGVPYNKMVVGCICWSAYSYGWNDAATYGAIIRQMKTTRGIRGAMVWDTAQESKEGYPFYQMAKTL